MKFNKKIILPVLAVVAIIAVIVYVVGVSNKTPYAPICFDFDAKTGKIVFSINEGYKIHHIQVREGHFDVPNYDKDTREIFFPTLKLGIGEHEFVYFVIQNYEGKVTEEYNVEYEILHQSSNEIIISVRYGNSPNPGKSDMYSFYY